MKNNKIIFVQGLGVIGSINAYCIAYKKKYFDVVGFESKNKIGKNIIKKINSGFFPFNSSDKKLNFITKKVNKNNNLFVTNNYDSIKKKPDIIICSLALKYFKSASKQKKEIILFVNNFKKIVNKSKKNTLIIIQTSLPPGFSEKYLIPSAKQIFKKNNIKSDPIICYSYERVTPGKNFADSFLNMQRVYAGNSAKAEKLFCLFFSKIINVKKFPLLKLDNITECEMAKIIENSYRSVNIAFINEWMNYSKNLKLNLNKVLNFIRLRPTHSNIRYPGLGVGGFCLTKDPLLAKYSSEKIFNFKKVKFPFSISSTSINKKMINHTIDLLKERFKNLNNKNILLIGITYLSGTDDIRNSASISLGNKLKKNINAISIFMMSFIIRSLKFMTKYKISIKLILML